MRQKDVDRIAGILEREMFFSTDQEVEGLQAAIGAIRHDIGWAQPELDMTSLDTAFGRERLVAAWNVVPECDETCAPHLFQFCSPECEGEPHIVRGLE